MTTNSQAATDAGSTANVDAAAAQVAAGGTAGDGTGGATGTSAEAGGETATDKPGETAGAEGVTPAAEVKEGDKPAETKDGEDKPEVLTGAPEAYADFKLPEGFALDEVAAGPFKELAKSSNLSQAGAQKMVDLATDLVDRTIKGYQAQHTEQVGKWAEQAKADPVVGGRNYDANVQVALNAVGEFGDAELKQAFETMGLGNHPAFVRAFYRIGKAMGEGGFVHGVGSEQPGKPVNPEAALAERMAREADRSGGPKKP